jgi:CIC family chloride channel protein
MSKFSDGLQYYLLVGVVGLIAASAAIGFYLLYEAIWDFTQHALAYSIFIIIPVSVAALGLPLLIVKRFAQTKTTGSGTHSVLEAYHLTNGEISLEDAIAKPVAGMYTIGLGGSAGPEGPSLLAGGGVASALSKRFKIKSDLRRRLFIAGAAAGLAATFRTPLTAILFALEIPYKNDFDRETLIEAIISSVPAYLLSVAVLGSGSIFGKIPAFTINFYVIGLSLLLGLICGFYSVFFTKTFAWTEQVSYILRKKFGSLGLILVGAAILSVCGFTSLYTIGVGFNFTNAVIQGTSLSVLVLVVIVLLKTFLTSVTLHFGGSGGLFFPTIVIGAGIGYIFAQFFDASYAVIFIAVGMAALLGGTHKILLTPVAFVIETLGGLFAIPALLANAVSYVISGNHSFYSVQPRTKLKTEELALERFYLKAKKLVPEKLKSAMISYVMTIEPVVLYQGITVREALNKFEETTFRVLPVIDERGHIIGVVNLEDLGYIDIQKQSMTLSETVMHKPIVIREDISLDEAAQLMVEKQQDHIYVVNNEGQLLGVVSGIDVVKKIIELLSS